MSNEKSRLPGAAANQPPEPHHGPDALKDGPLKDSLKAVAQAPSPGNDADRTALINRRDARSKSWLLQDAMKAVEHALGPKDHGFDTELPPTQAARPGRPLSRSAAEERSGDKMPDKTQMVRGPQKPVRKDFSQDPVVGWLVIIGGPGLGAYRPIFEGNNTVGRSPTQRIALDFGDDTISGEEQAFVRYDSSDREFLFVPNLAKTNVVSVNQAKPTTAVKLAAMDVITIGRTQLVFVPFCGEEFDWSDLADLKE
jgi:hypothetical protein